MRTIFLIANKRENLISNKHRSSIAELGGCSGCLMCFSVHAVGLEASEQISGI